MTQNISVTKRGWFTKAPFHKQNKHLDIDALKAIINGKDEALDAIYSILKDFGIGESKTVRLTTREQDEFASIQDDINLYDFEMIHEAIEKDLSIEEIINHKSTLIKIVGSEMVEKMLNDAMSNIDICPSLDHSSFLTFATNSDGIQSPIRVVIQNLESFLFEPFGAIESLFWSKQKDLIINKVPTEEDMKNSIIAETIFQESLESSDAYNLIEKLVQRSPKGIFHCTHLIEGHIPLFVVYCNNMEVLKDIRVSHLYEDCLRLENKKLFEYAVDAQNDLLKNGSVLNYYQNVYEEILTQLGSSYCDYITTGDLMRKLESNQHEVTFEERLV